MRCPDCGHEESRVIDSRVIEDGDVIRRRRVCSVCESRWTTHERVERRVPMVVKKDGRKQPFSREKVSHGLQLACRKRPIDAVKIDELVREVEARLTALRLVEVPASRVGETVMDVLRDEDPVAYIRFASVYGEFESVEQFVDAVQQAKERQE